MDMTTTGPLYAWDLPWAFCDCLLPHSQCPQGFHCVPVRGCPSSLLPPRGDHPMQLLPVVDVCVQVHMCMTVGA